LAHEVSDFTKLRDQKCINETPKSDKLRIYILDSQFIQHKRFCNESGGEGVGFSHRTCNRDEWTPLDAEFKWPWHFVCYQNKKIFRKSSFTPRLIDRIHNQSVEMSFITWPCSNQRDQKACNFVDRRFQTANFSIPRTFSQSSLVGSRDGKIGGPWAEGLK